MTNSTLKLISLPGLCRNAGMLSQRRGCQLSGIFISDTREYFLAPKSLIVLENCWPRKRLFSGRNMWLPNAHVGTASFSPSSKSFILLG